MQFTVKSSQQNLGIEAAPHVHSAMTTQKIMAYVMLALIPAYAVTSYFFGFGALIQFAISAVSATVFEIIVAFLRERKLGHHLSDLSYLVTAALLGLTLPPLLPWYLTVVATGFAILLVKHAFGGLGQNIFNPAMAGFIFLVIATPGIFYNTYLPAVHNAYSVVTPQKALDTILQKEGPALLQQSIKDMVQNVDSLTGATYLESVKTQRKSGSVNSIVSVDFASQDYIAYVYLSCAYLAGGILLIALGIIHYHMPLAFLLTMLAGGYLYHYFDPSMSITMQEHLLLGGTMLGAFFIITDPVTNAGTLKGRIVYSIFVAFLVIVIRVNGSYSDSVAFAVLLGNAAAPLIDVLTHRRPFGIGYKEGGLN